MAKARAPRSVLDTLLVTCLISNLLKIFKLNFFELNIAAKGPPRDPGNFIHLRVATRIEGLATPKGEVPLFLG